MSIKEVLHGALLKGPLVTPIGASNAWAGLTTIASGSTTVQVSTSVCKSDSIINATIKSLTDTSSGFGPSVEVRTIAPGGFIFSHSDGKAQARDVIIHWVLFNTSD